jgi:hypothetical protein
MRGPLRLLAILLVSGLMSGLVVGAAPVAAAPAVGPCDLRRGEDEGIRTFSRRLIRCAVDRWEVPGGADKAICIADAESNLNPRATSAGGEYLGLFQHSAEAWPDRYETWTRPGWGLDDSALSGRTNAVVTIRMVNEDGWGPWEGVGDC